MPYLVAADLPTQPAGERFRALLARHDGTLVLRNERQGRAADAVKLGADAAAELRGRAPADVLAH